MYRICSRCVMDTSDEDIVFDQNGHCNHCATFITNQEGIAYKKGVSEKKWDSILSKIKKTGKEKKYDCLIGVSGGIDSSYAVHLAVKQYGLRPLIIHMDNGWDTAIAVQNIKTIITTLGLDYVSHVIDWNEFREIQLAFLKSSTADLEYPTDIGILGSLYKAAAKYGINYIISAGNTAGEGILPLTWGYHSTHDFKYYKHIVNTYGAVKLNKVPHVTLLTEIYYRFIKNIKTVYLLNYMDYDKEKAKDFLIANYDWRVYEGKHHESRITAFWQGYVMPVKFNMDYRRATLSAEICSGHITREAALTILKNPPYKPADIEAAKNFIAKKFGITVEDLETYLKLPPKTYKNFPNRKPFMDFVFATYKKIYRRKRL